MKTPPVKIALEAVFRVLYNYLLFVFVVVPNSNLVLYIFNLNNNFTVKTKKFIVELDLKL